MVHKAKRKCRRRRSEILKYNWFRVPRHGGSSTLRMSVEAQRHCGRRTCQRQRWLKLKSANPFPATTNKASAAVVSTSINALGLSLSGTRLRQVSCRAKVQLPQTRRHMTRTQRDLPAPFRFLPGVGIIFSFPLAASPTPRALLLLYTVLAPFSTVF